MRPSILRALAVSTLLAASSAGADAPAPPGRRVVSAPLRLRLADVEPRRVDPGVDGRRIAFMVGASLRSRQRRLDACLEGVDLREDPLRGGARYVRGEIVFDRGVRPASTQVRSADRVPHAARRCVEEVTSSIRLGRAPTGRVELRYRYLVTAR